MARLSITLTDDLHDQIKRIAESSNVSIASTVRAILSDVVPRMTGIVEYLGTNPAPTTTDVEQAGDWLQDLQTLFNRAPEPFRDVVKEFPLELPPTTGRHD